MKKVITFTLLVLLVCGLGLYFGKLASAPENQIVKVEEKQNPQIVEKEKEKEEIITTSASISAIGDILIHDRVYEPAQIGDEKYDFTPHLKNVQSLLNNADITIANQESMIGGTEIGLSTYPSFNSPYEVGDILKESGIDLVTIANNHTLDRGEKAIQSAISHWNKLGIPYTGAFLSEEDKKNIRTIEKNGIVFSFLAYTYGTNGIETPKDKPYLVNRIDEKNIKQEIEQANAISDVVVVSLHFGKEYERLPNEEQKQLAIKTANAGADIIIGHHPHVLQPIEWIEREDGKRSFVAYSLGNFFTGQTEDYKDIGGVLKLNVEKKLETGEIVLKEPSFVPTFVNEVYHVQPLEQLSGKEKLYEEIKKHMNQWVPELTFSFT
ncbi:CapA family protein [Metabacillus halosaccharovorans]|uniref:CapA family protein n=1 Tax=Metabacillus halosaccharovorans TaxID=930124 RepID=UPI0009957A90|nr:CapA family protein [Metabacillus halosaccharovorans]